MVRSIEKGRALQAHRGDHSGVIILGKSFNEQLINTEHINIIGTKVNSLLDIAKIAQVWRDPRWETFRTIFVKDGNVVNYVGSTCRLPFSVRAFIAASDLSGIRKYLDSVIKHTGADSIYFVHNHPSGVPTPSNADINVTKNLYNIRLAPCFSRSYPLLWLTADAYSCCPWYALLLDFEFYIFECLIDYPICSA